MISLLFVSSGETEDVSPSLQKVQPLKTKNGYMVRSIQGLRMQITRRMDDRGGYDITRIGPYRISSSSTVWLSDPAVILVLKPQALVNSQMSAHATQVILHFRTTEGQTLLTVTASKSAFGPDITNIPTDSAHLFKLPPENNQGCDAISLSEDKASTIVVAQRGTCTFVQKMKQASTAGAVALIIQSDEEESLVPSADPVEIAGVHKQIPVVLLPRAASLSLDQAFASRGAKGMRVQILRNLTDEEEQANQARELLNTPVVVNGHWLVNCRLVYP